MTSIWGVIGSSSVWHWSPSIMAVDLAIDVAVGKVSLEAHVVSEKDIFSRSCIEAPLDALRLFSQLFWFFCS